MKSAPWYLSLLSVTPAILLPIVGSLVGSETLAQSITPASDGTGTTVDQQGDTHNINGGSLSSDETNLFHSFQEFGLDAGEIANFLANPHLNNIFGRVMGGNPSLINGLIQVTGGNANLYLMNPAGIVFGQNAQLNVPADFMATTATGIGFGENGWFNAFGTNEYQQFVGNPGQFIFDVSQPGSIINAGNLAISQGQNLTLLGGTVINTGELTAPGGRITIAAVPGSHRVKISQAGQLLSLEVEPLVNSSGQVIPFTPLDLAELLTGTEENLETGVEVDSAETVKLTDSDLILPNETDITIISGTIDVSNIENASANVYSPSPAIGGEINIIGKTVGLISANIDASGTNNGGTVRIGGDYQGEGIIPNADITLVDENSTIQADALTAGDGGTVIVWADGQTAFSGNISARGGLNTGDGGLVEVSGKKELKFGGTADTTADNGNVGTLLLDPTDILIRDDVGDGDDLDTSPFTFSGNPFGSPGQILSNDITPTIIFESELVALAAFNDVLLEATNTITIEGLGDDFLGLDPINFPGFSLRGSITFNSGGSFSMNPGDTIFTQGRIEISAESINAGTLVSGSGISLTADGNITTADLGSLENIEVNAGGEISTNRLLTTSNVTIGGVEFSSPSPNSGAIQLEANGTITTGGINASSSKGNGANITLISQTGEILIDSTRGTVEDTSGAVFSYSESSGRGGNITLRAFGNIATGPIVSSSDQSNGGQIEIISQNGAIDTSAGELRIDDEIVRDTGWIISGSGEEGTGGDITVTARDNIITGPVVSASRLGNGGSINLTSTVGTINTLQGLTSIEAFETALSLINVSPEELSPQTPKSLFPLSAIIAGSLVSGSEGAGNGGNITVTAYGSLSNGGVLSGSREGNGGDVRLTSTVGDVETFVINTQSLGTGRGGNVEVNSAGFVQVTGSVFAALQEIPPGRIDPNDIPPNLNQEASISTAGGVEDGNITIRHGGGLRNTPFEVGNATTNGTTSAISSGDFTISPFQSFPGNYTLGNIRIITDNPTIIGLDNLSIIGLCPPYCYQIRESVNILDDSVINNSPVFNSVLAIEGSFTNQYENYWKLSNTPIITLAQTQAILQSIEQATGVKPALIYAVFVPGNGVGDDGGRVEVETRKRRGQEREAQRFAEGVGGWESMVLAEEVWEDGAQLELILVTAEGEPIRFVVPGATRERVMEMVKGFRRAVTDIRIPRPYLPSAQQLYQWLIAPLEEELRKREINNLAFIMDQGLRSLPVAALHDGNGFIVERYSIGFMPSLSLTDTRYVDVRDLQVLAMGASEFTEQNPLPAVPVELSAIADKLWQGESFLNSTFTPANLKAARADQPFGIVHLATHGEFKPGKPENSYIQFWNTRLSLDQIRQLGLHNPPVELMVLSACRTALGNQEAELGFTGLAVQAGVKSALGSLWYVSDEGTLGLMTTFYQNLKQVPIKAEALRQTQLAMIQGQVRIENGQLITPNSTIDLPEELAGIEDKAFTHPYFWSAFTLVGSPW
ncbi:MAG: CHAT domain-containing protein [Coleofasciculus sp. B1-GNL1-01]|uniref:CHAT domain-containing protein n=1 Tax=Coleofasciculus sp. B1-GNL1-01 TaxID=3068484 RepID=UPI0032F0A422